jgi:modulator of FtsH protease HflK
MNLNPVLQTLVAWPARLKHRTLGMFNLNDNRWGRDGEKPPSDKPAVDDAKPNAEPETPTPPPEQRPRPKGANQGPPDLDELWRDFNKKLNGLFGGNKNARGRPAGNNGGGDGGGNTPPGGGFQPDMKSAGIGVGLIAAVAALIWLGTGFFIVQEGQQAVITRFGELKGTRDAGFNWRMPYPIERHETVALTQLRSVEIGKGSSAGAAGLKESSMLTQDENIVDIKFTIQYRLKSAADYLFQNRNPDDAVKKAAESAIREVVGKGTMDTVLNKDRESIQRDVVKSVQAQLDRYKTGILIQTVNIQNVQPPEPVQAAFDDALKAGQDRDRLKNEGQAYANEVVPRAEGDAQRFKSVLTEYQKAPQVTRDRMYTDAMQQIYSSVTKVMVDSKQGSNLLYLPLDKLMQAAGAGSSPSSADIAVIPAAPAAAAAPAPAAADNRSRDGTRTRDRDNR